MTKELSKLELLKELAKEKEILRQKQKNILEIQRDLREQVKEGRRESAIYRKNLTEAKKNIKVCKTRVRSSFAKLNEAMKNGDIETLKDIIKSWELICDHFVGAVEYFIDSSNKIEEINAGSSDKDSSTDGSEEDLIEENYIYDAEEEEEI